MWRVEDKQAAKNYKCSNERKNDGTEIITTWKKKTSQLKKIHEIRQSWDPRKKTKMPTLNVCVCV